MSQYDFQGGNLNNGLAWPLDPQTNPPTFGPPGVNDTAEINGQDASSGSMSVASTVFDGASTLEAVTIVSRQLTVDAGASAKQNSASSTVTVTTGAAAIIVNGTYELDSGTVTVGANNLAVLALVIGPQAGGTFNQTGGKTVVTGSFALGYGGQPQSTYKLSGGELDTIRQEIGLDTTASGLFTQTGGVDNAGQAIVLGTNSVPSNVAGKGEYDLSGTGVVNVGTVYVGSEPGGTGIFTLNGAAAKLNISGDPNPGYLAPGLIVGGQSTGTFTQGGGTVTINMTNGNSAALDVGRHDIASGGKGVGTYNFNGGTINVTGANQNEIVGDSGQGTFLHNNAAGNAQNNDPTGMLIVGNASTSVGTYTLGGPATNTLTVNSIDIGGATGGAGQSTGTFNFDTAAGDLAVLTVKAASGVGLTVGDSGTGTFNQGGGALALANSDLIVGAQLGLAGGGKGGTYNLTGGMLTSGQLGIPQREVVGDQDTGIFNQNKGANSTNTVFGTLIVGNQTGGNGTYNLGGAATNALNVKTITIGASLASTGVFNFDTAAGDAATLKSTAAAGAVGLTVGDLGSGTMNQAAGVLTLASNLVVGNRLEGGTDQGTYNLSGPAASQLTASMETVGNLGVGLFNQTGGTNTAGGQLLIGNGVTGDGTYTLGGGTLTANDIVDIGVQQGATGVFNYNAPGAVLNLAGVVPAPLLTIGDAGQGTFNQSAGVVTTPTNLEIGAQPTGDGAYNLSGGTLSAPAGANGGLEIVGDQGTGVFNQTGGVNAVGTTLIVGNQSGGDGTYTLGGGGGAMLNARQILIGAQAGSTGVFNDDTGDATTPAWNAAPPAAVQELVVGVAGTGTFNQSADAITLIGLAGEGMNGPGRLTQWQWDLSVGSALGGNGTYNLTGGALSVVFGAIGDSGRGTFQESGGNASFGAKGVSAATQGTTLSLGDQHSGVGNLNVSGSGTVAVYGTAIVGNQGEGRAEQQGSASVAISGALVVGNFATGNGAYTASGGALGVGAKAEIGNQGNGTFSETLGTAVFAGGLVVGASKGSAGFVNLDQLILPQSPATFNAEQPSIIGDFGQGTFTLTGGLAVFTSASPQTASLVVGGDAGGTGVLTLGTTLGASAPSTLVIDATNAQSKLVDGLMQVGANGATGTFNYNIAAGDAATLQSTGAAQGKAATAGPTLQLGVNAGTGTLKDGGGALTLADLQIGADNQSTGTALVSGLGTDLVTGSLELGAVQGAGSGADKLGITGGASVEVDGLGAVQGAGANTLLIDALGKIVGHGLINSDQTGVKQLAGGAVIPTYSLAVINNGTVEASDGSLVIHGSIAGGSFKIDVGSTLEVAGAVAASTTIAFNGGGTLIVDDPTAFKGAIAGFVPGVTKVEFLHTPFPDAFSGGATSQILIENTAGAVALGTVSGGQTTYANLGGLGPEWTFHGAGDFLGDGRADYLIENTAGAVVVGEVTGSQVAYTTVTGLGPEWKFVANGDFLGDTRSDFLIENAAGAVDAGEVQNGHAVFTQVAALGPEWKFEGAGDFLSNGHDQFLIENTAGSVALGDYESGQIHYTVLGGLGPEWKFEGVGDFLGDGRADFLIENTAGAVFVGEDVGGAAAFTMVTALGPEWKFVGVGDYLGEGHDQFLIENAAGAVDIGDYLNGQIHFTQVSALGPEWAFHG